MRFTFDRSFYIPEDAVEVDTKGTDAAVWTYETNRAGMAGIYAVGFHGKAQKPDFHVRFRTLAHRAEYIIDYIEGRRRRAEVIAERKVTAKQPHTLKLGDILESSWGYDQTNIDFYEITRLIGTTMVEIRELAQERKETHFMQGDCTPVPGHYISEPTRHRIAGGTTNAVKVRDWGVWARPWSGRTAHWTAYA